MAAHGRSDRNYFDCYARIGIHEDMVGDASRTGTYREAMMKSPSKFKDATVLDVGMGTGVLSFFAVQAGAKKEVRRAGGSGWLCIASDASPVIGVEGSDIAEAAKEVVEANGMAGTIFVHHGTVEALEELPGGGQADILVSEWMGYALLYEYMLESVIDARDRLLKPGGLLYPEVARLLIAPFDDDQERSSKAEFWKSVYGFDFSPVASYAEKLKSGEPEVRNVGPQAMLAMRPVCAKVFDCRTVTKEELAVDAEFSFVCIGSGTLHGLAIWFEVDFPTDGECVTLRTGPEDRPTHWEQTLLHLGDGLQVQQDSKVVGKLTMSREEKGRRGLSISMTVAVDGGDVHRQEYAMPW